MSDQAFRNAPSSPNVEDRRDERSDIINLMFQAGLLRPEDIAPHTPWPGKINYGPGAEHLPAGDFILPSPEEDPIPTRLGIDAGLPELFSMIAGQQNSRIVPTSKK